MRINPATFGAQMAAAGLSDLPVQWTADGLVYFGALAYPADPAGDAPQADRDAYARARAEVDDARGPIEALLAAHDPASPPPRPVPEVISDRQCFQQLAILGKISQDEALAAVTIGALPKAVTDGIASLPAEQQFPARMLLCGATEFHRSHPMTPAFLAMVGLGLADRDPLWTAAAAL